MSYPSSLDDVDSLMPSSGSDKLNNPSHFSLLTLIANLLNAIQAKLGIDDSEVATSLDYLLKNPASVNPGHLHSQTKQIFIPAVPSGAGNSIVVSYGAAVNMADGADAWNGGSFVIPDDYVDGSTVAIYAVWRAAVGSGNLYWSCYTYHGANGETSTETGNPNQTTAIAGSNYNNITNVLNATVYDVGDFVGIQFMRKGAQAEDTLGVDAKLHGFIIEYIAKA